MIKEFAQQKTLVEQKRHLTQMIEQHNCEASRDEGCECTWWNDRIDQINLKLNNLKQLWQLINS